jgi:ATP-dependent RNA helicase RhlE
MPFRTLGLEPRILQAVEQAGYTEPTPIQTAAIPQVLAGHDLIGIAQTGTGKTAAFTLPILTRLAAQLSQSSPDAGPHHELSKAVPGPNAGPSTVEAPQEPLSPSDGARVKTKRQGIRVLVVAPTRELVVQIEENVRAYARHLPLRVATVFGGVSEYHQKIALSEGADIVIATPGRLIDLMSRRFGDFSGLQFLVLDEADRMLDMGFLPSIRDIVHRLPRQRQTLMFSATFSREIETLTHQFQRNPKTVQIGRRADPATTVTQLVYEVRNDLKMNLLLHLLRDPGLNMVLLFSRTKHGADKVARKLEERGIRTGTLHSNRSQNQRLRALKDFKNGSTRVLVATDIAARGIDVDGISHVVNYDFPKHPEDYVHRIGRTGRAHAVGDALSFATPEDHSALRALERFIGRGLVRKRADGFDYQAAPVRRAEVPHESDGRRAHVAHGHANRPQVQHTNRPPVPQGKPHFARRRQWEHETDRGRGGRTDHAETAVPRAVAEQQPHANRPQTQQARHPQVRQGNRPQVQQSAGPRHSRPYPGNRQDRGQGNGNAQGNASRGPRRFHRRAKAAKPFWARHVR